MADGDRVAGLPDQFSRCAGLSQDPAHAAEGVWVQLAGQQG